jgi:uridine kinase
LEHTFEYIGVIYRTDMVRQMRGREQDMDHGMRDELLSCLAEAVNSVAIAHPTRVAIDGVPGAGKTTLADELAVVLRAQGREVIRATIEDFLAPRSVRHPWGDSAEGWYNHSTDLGALHQVLLDPLGLDGDRRIQRAVYDKAADIAVSPPVTTAAIDAVLLFDGVFLLRKELLDRWDLRIFVSATFEKALDRSRIRDRTPLMSADEVEQRYRRRYLPSQQFYFETARPTEHADVIVYNDEPRRPAWEARTL